MKQYILESKDFETNYFHFTKKTNIESIEKNGLLPKRSFRTKSFEKTKKVFFVEGLDNLLILFNCWITDCEIYPHIPFLFNIGTKIKANNKISKTIINSYFKWTRINKLHKIFAYKYFDIFLKKYIILKINLIEGIDFDSNDIDQVKAKGYSKDLLINVGYSPKYSDLETTKMDKWNMHTFSNHGVKNDDIQICCLKNYSINLDDILKYALTNTKLDIKEVCPKLHCYLKSKGYEVEKNDINITKEKFFNIIDCSYEQRELVSKLIQEIQKEEIYTKKNLSYHNIEHIERVIYYCIWIINKMKQKNKEVKYQDILIYSALYHDSGRSIKALNEKHGIVGAKIARKKLQKKFDEKELNIIQLLIEIHEKKEDKIEFEKYEFSDTEKEEVQLLSNILKDADALDRNRIRFFGFGKCNPKYLRTDEAKQIYNLSNLFLEEYNKYKKC